jgi:hypothetical protein
MLEALDEIRRRVSTGEVEGLIVMATCANGAVLSRMVAEPPPPHGILILQDVAAEARNLFLEQFNKPDDGAPTLGVVDGGKPDDRQLPLPVDPANVRLEDCDELDTRALNVVRPAGTVAELAQLKLWDVLRSYGCGRKTMARFEALLRRFGLTWADAALVGYDQGKPSAEQLRAARDLAFPPPEVAT